MKTFPLLSAVIGIAFCCLAANSFTSSQELTRPLAAKLLQNTSDFKLPSYILIEEGDIDFDYFQAMGVEQRLYNALESLGLVSVVTLPRRPTISSPHRISLTENGKKESAKWIRDQSSWKIPCFFRELVAVTSVEEGSGDLLRVEFSWRWVATSFAAAFGNAWKASATTTNTPHPDQYGEMELVGFSAAEEIQGPVESEIFKSEAVFSFRDGSWRIVKVQW